MTTVIRDSGVVVSSQGYKQVVTYTESEARIRLTVYRDSYDKQSWARAEFLTTEGWKELASRSGDELAHLPSKYAKDTITRDLMVSKELDSLEREVIVLLGLVK